MSELASLVLLASLASEPTAHRELFRSAPQSTTMKIGQIRFGQTCVTNIGACNIPPRPVNTQCFCGNIPGVVR
jgi:hypothetical protein